MAVEALTRRSSGDMVHRWIDSYRDRLEERPRGIAPISADQWRDPLGDPIRTDDWITFFERQLAERPWRDVLVKWWPRLLPGIAAGATHGSSASAMQFGRYSTTRPGLGSSSLATAWRTGPHAGSHWRP